MRIDNLNNMKLGWFIGDFVPSIFRTEEFEVALKKYDAGDYEEKHFHKKATEITVIIEGKVKMNQKQYISGDIIVMEPNESTDFLALTDVINVVVKIPSVMNDKFITEE